MAAASGHNTYACIKGMIIEIDQSIKYVYIGWYVHHIHEKNVGSSGVAKSQNKTQY